MKNAVQSVRLRAQMKPVPIKLLVKEPEELGSLSAHNHSSILKALVVTNQLVRKQKASP